MIIKKHFKVLLLILSISGCTNINPNVNNYSLENSIQKINKESIIENYSNIVFSTYQDSLEGVKKLQQEVNKFVSKPSKESFELVKDAWLKSRIPYSQTEAFKFYGGPIDEGLGERINASPINEVLIDYVDENKTSGIINNQSIYSEINENLLSELNKNNTMLGFHVIEFLLWGQDLTNNSESGQRKYTDYVTDGKGTFFNQVNRGKYLVLATDLLVNDLQKLVDQWDPSKKDNYRIKFKNMTPDEAINNIIKGIETLSSNELSVERMSIPLDVGEREEESSCFSDSTQSDLLQNTKGIENIFMGAYTKNDGSVIKGASLYELIKEVKPEFALKLKGQISSSYELVSKIKNPFDQEIRANNLEGNKRVKLAIDSIQYQGISISEINSEIGLSIKGKE